MSEWSRGVSVLQADGKKKCRGMACCLCCWCFGLLHDCAARRQRIPYHVLYYGITT